MNKARWLIQQGVKSLKSNGVKDTMFRVKCFAKRRVDMLKSVKHDYLEFDIPKKEQATVTMKGGPVVYIVAGIPYYDIGCGQRCAQLAKTFNKMGYCVRYLYGVPSADPKDKDLILPVAMHMLIDSKSVQYVRDQAKKDDLFIFEAPFEMFSELVDVAVEKECKIIYENIDNWETSLGGSYFDENVLIKLLRAAHMLVGTARPLVMQLESYLEKYGIEKEGKYIKYLANAVDDELFCGTKVCKKPEDLVIGERTMLYYGSLWGEWFRWDLIIGLAKRHPEYSINLIGNADNLGKRMKECPSNIHFLGLKEQKELPAYLQYVDYSMLPFERGKIGDYVSPLKIFEYIAMYSRVLSTTLPDVAGYPNVYFGETVEEWEAVIAADNEVEKDKADLFTNENTWSYRVTSMLESLYPEINQSILKDKLSIVILNYNNKNVIFRCVNTLLAYRELYNYRIIVVDNGSKDGSYELLQEKYSEDQILLLRNEKNGCSSGRNLGVAHAETEYVLYLDSDQWIAHKYWLKPYEDVMKCHKDFGCIGWGAGYFLPSGMASVITDELPGFGIAPSVLCDCGIGYVATCGMLMRVDDFHKIGGFDTFYDPTGYEDTDMALAIRNLGKEMYYCRYLGVIHLPHQTTDKVFAEHEKLINRNREYFINKWKKENPKLLKYVK